MNDNEVPGDSMGIGNEVTSLENLFRQQLNQLPAQATMLELGTRRWEPDRPTHHRAWLPDHAKHIKADYLDGDDVDIIADAHHLTTTFEPDTFDAILAVSVWEHLEHPWIATQQTLAVAKPDAPILIVTHHTFPRHGYPSDYTRWDARGLEAMFEWAGAGHAQACHEYPCQIIPPPEVIRWDPTAPAWLNVICLARK